MSSRTSKATTAASANGTADEADRLREGILNQVFRSKVLDLPGLGKVEIREPSLAVRTEYQKRLKMEANEDGKMTIEGDLSAAQVWLAIGCTYSLGPHGKHVLHPRNEAELRNTPANGFVSEIASTAVELMNEAEEVSKNSEATLSAS